MNAEDFTDFNDNDDCLIGLCGQFLQLEHLMVCWANAGTGIDEALAIAVSMRWGDLMRYITHSPARTPRGLSLKLRIAAVAAREAGGETTCDMVIAAALADYTALCPLAEDSAPPPADWARRLAALVDPADVAARRERVAQDQALRMLLGRRNGQ